MDLKFMWYANATVVNNIMPQHKRFDDVYTVDVLQKTIRDKYMKYDVSIGGERFHYNYTFFSNVCIAGSLEIIDVSRGKAWTYAIERNNDSIRLYTDLENYNELYLYNNSTIIDIQVNACRKSFISCINIKQVEDRSYTVTVVRSAVTEEQKIFVQNKILTVRDMLLEKEELEFDAVAATDDGLAIGALKYARKKKLSVPGDISIIGFNNSELSVCCEPELSSIDSRSETLCKTAVDSMIALLKGRPVRHKKVVPCRLVKRHTTNF